MITVTATALAAVAAIGGLWAQAVTTYWSQQTAKDQLQQSREESEKEERAQAEMVSAWIEGNPRFWKVHVLNRSADPVPELLVGVNTRVQFSDSEDNVPAYAYVLTHRLAPCTELIYSTEQLSPHWTPARWGKTRPGKGATTFVESVDTVVFGDRDGRNWRRLRGGQITDDVNRTVTPTGDWWNQFVDNPQVKKAAACSGSD